MRVSVEEATRSSRNDGHVVSRLMCAAIIKDSHLLAKQEITALQLTCTKSATSFEIFVGHELLLGIPIVIART